MHKTKQKIAHDVFIDVAFEMSSLLGLEGYPTITGG